MAPGTVKDSGSIGADPYTVSTVTARPLLATIDPRQAQESAAQVCADVIKFRYKGETYPDTQAARIEPNERLIKVFGIDNAFTTRNKQVKSVFSKKMGVLMKSATKIHEANDQGDWSGMRNQALFYFDEYLVQSKKKMINLAELTQFITLELSLFYLWPDSNRVKKSTSRFEDVLFIGHCINQLWIDSKKVDLELPEWEHQTKLRTALQRVIAPETMMPGAFPLPASDNPLNYLLPAYETMWRVVMHGFLEIQHRNAPQGPSWHTTMTDYLRALKTPTETQDNAFYCESDNGVRPIDIAKETLRLYPPTRRVHRIFDGETHYADIEACQRMDLLGGENSLLFCPERWQGICAEERDKLFGPETHGRRWALASNELKRKEEKLGYMPFASWCAADHPETKEFGMKMVALLIAVLCEKLGSEWELENAGSLPERGAPLDTNRGAYGDLVLKKL